MNSNESDEARTGERNEYFIELGKDALRVAVLSAVSIMLHALADSLRESPTRHRTDRFE